MRTAIGLVVAVVIPVIDVAVSVVHFSAMEIMEVLVTIPVWVLAMMRVGAMVAIAWIVMAVYISVEVAVAVKPWACADEESVDEPGWAVIAIGCAVIRRVGIVAIGAYRLRPDVHAKRYLGLRAGRADDEQTSD